MKLAPITTAGAPLPARSAAAMIARLSARVRSVISGRRGEVGIGSWMGDAPVASSIASNVRVLPSSSVTRFASASSAAARRPTSRSTPRSRKKSGGRSGIHSSGAEPAR